MGVYGKLKHYWRMETTGSRADEFGLVTLSDNFTVLTATGKKGNAADFESANGEYLSNATATNVRPGDQSFFFFGWVQFESQSAVRDLWGKWNATGNQREYVLLWNTANSRLEWYLSADGSGSTRATWSAATGTGVLRFVYCWYDHANTTIGLNVNNGTAVTDTHAGGVHAGTGVFAVGVRQNTSTYHDGLIDELGYGEGDLLTTDEQTWLYNDNNGRDWDEIRGHNKLNSRVVRSNLIGGRLIG